MEVTGVRLYQEKSLGKGVLAYASVCLDQSFMVHEIRLIDSPSGGFVAMPTRHVKQPCPACRHKNALLAKYCNECGGPVTPPDPIPRDGRGKPRFHYDIAHPVEAACRLMIERAIKDELRAAGDSGATIPMLVENGHVPLAPTNTGGAA